MFKTSYLLVAMAYPELASAQAFTYVGMCEASAGVLLDEGRFAAVSDETNNMRPDEDTLHAYRLSTSEPVLYPLPIKSSDIEAATRVGEITYWLTSHSLNKDNEDRPKRKHLFSFSVNNLGASQAEGDFTGLREMIAPAIEAATGITVSQLEASLNIEGLTATTDERLLVGLREPLTPAVSPTERQALIIDIGKASEIYKDQPRKLAALDVFQLSLGGRGIRSIERVGDRFLIIAGTVHASDDDFRKDFGQYHADLGNALYWWDGQSNTAAPVDFSFSTGALGSASPEGIIPLNSNEVLILGDNGDLCSDENDPVKDRSFPTITKSF